MKQKIKNVLGSFRVLNENNRYLKEILKGQVFNSTIQESVWLREKSFSPGGWAIDYAVLYTLYRILNDINPKSILEFGLGQSSKMIHQYAAYFKDTSALTIEHDEKWVNFFKRSLTEAYPINIELCTLETIKYKGYETLSYKDLENILQGKRYDLVIVDAPFGAPHYSRSQVINLVPHFLGKDFCIIIDDYNRSGEKETFTELCKTLSANNIAYHSAVYSGLKDHALLCSGDWKFLTSL